MERDPHQLGIDQPTPEPLLGSVKIYKYRAFLLLNGYLTGPLQVFLKRLVESLPDDLALEELSEAELVVLKKEMKAICELLTKLKDLTHDVRNRFATRIALEIDPNTCEARNVEEFNSDVGVDAGVLTTINGHLQTQF